jgi:phenylacetate-CoA ligase
MDWQALITRRVIAPLWARWEGSPYLRHYRRLRRTQFDDPGTIRKRQWAAVENLLRHAYATVPFYRARWKAAGLTPQAIRGFADYQALPVLTKQDIRSARDALLSAAYYQDRLCLKKTSGSTGVALEIFVDEECLQWKRACTLRADEWSGWRLGEPVAKIWGNPEYLERGWRGRLRNAVLDRARYLDTLKMDAWALERFAQSLRRRPASLIFGHAHSVYLFADYLHGRGMDDIRPRGIITTAMVLHDWQRRRIEQVFRCPVTNRYGCEEVSLIACECEHHDGLHVNADNVYVEILRDGQPARPGEAGAIVVTDLSNRAMPLLRYQVGDVAVLDERRCPCGRGLPLLKRLEGREADYVVTADGDLVSGISLTENFALHVPGLAQLQIVQETVHRFVFHIVKGPDFGPDSLARIDSLVRERFGPDVEYACEYVGQIPQEPSGKYRFCISKVHKSFSHTPEGALP